MTQSVHHVTVVVPTRRRPAALDRVLHGLARQRDPGVPWDVVVVDNDTGPGTAATSSRAALAALAVPVRVVVEPALGAANARNRGITEAGGTIVAFIDDDVVPDDDWLQRLVEPLLNDRCEAVGGQVRLDASGPRPRWLSSWLLPYLSHFHPSDQEVDLASVPSDVLTEPYVLTANAAFTAEVLDRTGGFDPQLGTRDGVPFGNEELRLCRQVLAGGGRIRYLPTARVVHELPPSRLRRSYFARRLYAQGRSDWMLDRDVLATARSAGVRRAFELFGSDVRVAMSPERRTPVHRWLLSSAIQRAGFLREAVSCLVRRW
ncbi:MAG: glucosyl-dolichyl phosphate glucuronosyltransferase [Acidimicrobiaceae bacterium]